jgi:hypothetical protein
MRARAVYLGLFATTLGFTLAAATRQFAPASSIGVSAKEIGSARNIVTRWQTKHAWRNVSDESVVNLIIATKGWGQFFQEAGRSVR